MSIFLILWIILILLPGTAMAGTEEYEAEIEGGSSYTSLQDAVNAADGNTVKLLKDIVISSKSIRTRGKNFTLDLNGFELKSNSTTVIVHSSGGILTITDSAGGGMITNTTDDTDTGMIYVGTGTLNINGATLVSAVNTAIYLVNGGSVNVNGGTVECNRTTTESNKATILNTGSGSVIVNNSTVKSDGTYSILNKSTNGTVRIINSTVESSGGTAIDNYSSETLEIDGSTVKGKKYGIYMNHGDLIITGGTVESEEKTTIYLTNNSNSNLSVSGGTVKNTGSATAIYSASEGKITISDNAKIISNVNSSIYGTIYVSYGAVLEIAGGTIENTSVYGNAIFGDSCRIIIKKGGNTVIKSTNRAMNKAPNLSEFPMVQVTASENYNGSEPLEYKSKDIGYYKHLIFEESTGIPVSDLNLTDKLTSPQTGEIPQTEFDSEQYTGTVSWNGKPRSDNPEKFIGSTAYTATVVLKAKSDYTFSGVAENSIIYDNSSNITHDMGTGKTLTVTINFPTTEPSTLQEIVVTQNPTKMVYKFGEWFSSAGMRVRTIYNDGTVNNVPSFTIDKTGPLTMSDTVVTITALGTNVTTTITITFNKANGPTAPVNLIGIAPSSSGGSGGKISGTTANMEYADNTEFTDAKDCRDDETMNLVPGTYYVRVKATETHEAGAYIMINIPEYYPYPIKIGEKGYETLQEAVDEVQEDQTIRLMEDINLVDTVLIEHGNSFTIDLNGCTLNGGLNPAITHSGGGTLIIKDTSSAGSGKMTSARTYNESGSGTIYLKNGEETDIVLEIIEGRIENTTENGNAIYNAANGKIMVKGNSVISGKGMAMNTAPDLSGFPMVQVTASENYNGSEPLEYKSKDIEYYRHLTFEESTETSVDDLSLENKLPSPVIDGFPKTYITCDQYTGTVSWSGNPEKFIGSTAYTATVVLRANSGYTFSGLAQNALTHIGASSVTHEMGTGSVLTVTVDFTEVEERILQRIEITQEPKKTVYQFGEMFITEGMVVKAIYNDGTVNDNFTDYTVDKTEPLTMSDTLITLTAHGTSITTTQLITINKADGPEVTGVTAVGCTTPDNNDGMLVGVTEAMEYKKVGEGRFTPVGSVISVSGSAINVSGSAINFTGNALIGLTSGEYLVRFAETDTHEEGPISRYIVASYTTDPIPTYTISGSITDRITNRGIEGAIVQLKSAGSNIGSAVYTDSNGAYTITGVHAGTYTIDVNARGYDRGTINDFDVTDTDISGKDLTLTRTNTFVSVTYITMNNNPSVRARKNMILTGTVIPSDATNRTIVWSIENANGTGATINGSTFRASAAGTVIVKATVVNGVSEGNDYSKTFTITVTASSTPGSNPTSPSGPSSPSSPVEKREGVVVKDQQQEDGAPIFNLNNDSDELKSSVLTPKEQRMVAEGEDAKIILKVSDISASVSEEEKKLIQDRLALENGISGTAAAEIPVLYVDLTLYKQVGNRDQTRVTETNGKISISLKVPEEFLNTDKTKIREFYVIRIHNGEAIRLQGTYDAEKQLFTFETDRFSTYALTYQDTVIIKTYNDFHHLRLTAKAGKTSQTLSYKKVANVDGYLIYGGKCGEEMKLLAEVSGDTTSYKLKGLKQGTNYKYQVKAYRMIDGEKVTIVTSKVIHTITDSKTYANPTEVTSKTSSLELEEGKSKTVTFKVVLPKNKKLKEHAALLRYESSNKEIATVNSKGKVTAKTKGTCYIYAYAQNGVYKRIKVTVK